MSALPHLQRPESQSSEKKNYRLSLNDSEVKHQRRKTFPSDRYEKQTGQVIDNSANSEDVRGNKYFLDRWYGDNHCFDRQFGGSTQKISHSTTPNTLLRHRILKGKNENSRGLPRWLSKLGLWLPQNQKLNFYDTFTRHLTLLDRSKENMLDPCPHIARCSHARTRSALQKQRARLKLEAEYRESERFVRLLDRFKKITSSWENFTRQFDAMGDEHSARLEAFKKTKDHYTDPLDAIKLKRGEREKIEREKIEKEQQRLQEEEARQKKLSKRRKMIPEIIITHYDEEQNKLFQSCSTLSDSEKLNSEGLVEEGMDVSVSEDALSKLPLSLSPGTQFLTPPKHTTAVTENMIVDWEDKSQGSQEETVHDMNFLVPPSLSSLDVTENIKDSAMLVDDTVGVMTGIVPVPLGMSNGLIPDSAIKASSSLDRYHTGAQARLENTKRSKNGGAWCPKGNTDKQYLEVDLGSIATIMQVATQGYPGNEKIAKKDLRWVKSYTLAFSEDGKKWTSYEEGGAVKVLEGNSDNNTAMLHSLADPIEARYVRFQPKTWRNGIAMRVEVYGNFTDDCPTPCEPKAVSPDLSLPEETTPNVPTPKLAPFIPVSVPSPQKPAPLIYASVPSPPKPASLVTRLPSPIYEVNVETSEKVELLKCTTERMTPLEGWEEETVDSIVYVLSEEEAEEREVDLSSPDININGSKQSPKMKRKHKKPKLEKKEKKRKPSKKKRLKLPAITTSMDDLPEVEDELEPEADEENDEDMFRIPTPPLPEINKTPMDSSRLSGRNDSKRFSMFSSKSISPSEEKSKRSRAQADNTIRQELLRQQLAEDRRKKLLSLPERKRSTNLSSLTPDPKDFGPDVDSFIFKYCILNDGQVGYYRRVFESFDEDQDDFLFPEEILEALECVNKNLLEDSHLKYIFRALELCDCSLENGADFKFFSVVAAFSQKIAALDDYAKILISKLDFTELDYKLQRAKSLYKCYADETTGKMSMELLTLELTAGGLDPLTKSNVLRSLGPTTYLDFLDFLTYIPLFIHIHEHVLSHPLYVSTESSVR